MMWFSNRVGTRSVVVSLLAGLLIMQSGCDSSSAKPAAAPVTEITPAPVDPAAKTPPKLVVEGGDTFDFGTTEIGQEFEHTFVIKNEGDKPISMKAGIPSCATCTSFKLERGKPEEMVLLKPKDSIKAFVKWHIKNENPEFRQFAPLMLEGGTDLKLYVVGQVVKRIVLSPIDRWNIGEVIDGQPKEFLATITSATLDHFDIESMTNANPALKVTATPLSPEKLKELKVKSGYDLKAVLDSKIPVGDFTDRVSIKVLDPKPIPLVVEVIARRTGPLQIFGPNYNDEQMALGLGDFDPGKDFMTRLHLFTRGVSGELTIEKFNCKDQRFSVELKPDTKFKGQTGDHRKYELIIKVAASDRAVVYSRSEPLLLELVTNQPQVGTVLLKVRCQALKQ